MDLLIPLLQLTLACQVQQHEVEHDHGQFAFRSSRYLIEFQLGLLPPSTRRGATNTSSYFHGNNGNRSRPYATLTYE